MIEAPDLKSLGPGFKSRSDCQLMLLPAPSSTSWLLAMLVNSQLICLPPVEILNLIMFISIFICHCLFMLVLKSPKGEWPIRYTICTKNQCCHAVTYIVYFVKMILTFSQERLTPLRPVLNHLILVFLSSLISEEFTSTLLKFVHTNVLC